MHMFVGVSLHVRVVVLCNLKKITHDFISNIRSVNFVIVLLINTMNKDGVPSPSGQKLYLL